MTASGPPRRLSTFFRTRGIPQGDVSSPHNWVSFFDIALQRAADTVEPSAFIAAGQGGQLCRRPRLNGRHPLRASA